MNPATSVSDLRMGYELAWCLNELYAGGSLDLVNRTMLTTIGEETVAQEWPISDLVPPCAMFKGPSVTVVLLQGIRTATQVGALCLSWLEGRIIRENSGFVRVADRVSDTLFQRMEAFGALDNRRYILAGHSYGGLCLMSLASRLANRDVQHMVSLASFGSPLGGDDRMAHSMQRVDYCRYMNVGDNVVFAPPIAEEAPLMHLLLTSAESYNLHQLRHVGVGKLMTAEGGISDAGYPPLPGIFTDLSLANFLVRNEAPVSLSHAISEYTRRLRRHLDLNPPAPVRFRAAANQIGVVEPVQVPPVPPTDILAGVDAGLRRRAGSVPLNQLPGEQAVADAAGNPVNPQAAMGPAPPPSVGNRPVTAYFARKIGRTWVVYYMQPDRICLIAAGKAHARRFAARMNQSLNAWNRAPLVDEGAFEQSAIDAFN